MMQKIIWSTIICFFFSISITKGQSTIIFRPPNGSMISKEQLLQCIVVNNKELLNVQYAATLQSQLNGEPLLIIKGEIPVLKLGANALSKTDFTNLIFDNISNVFSSDFLPIGKYIYCIELQFTTTKGNVTLGKDCFQFEIKALQPPMLIYPQHQAILSNPKPIFQWLAPQPSFLLNNIKYEFNLVEVKEAQKPIEAINDNFPVMQLPFAVSTQAPLQSSIEGLKHNQEYAWRVKAFTEQGTEMFTDVWTFKYVQDTVADIINNAPYTKAEIGGIQFSYLHQGTIKLFYANTLSDSIATIYVYDAKGNTNAVFYETVKLNQGSNEIMLQTDGKVKLDTNNNYLIVLTNSKGEKWSYLGQPKYYR